MPGQCQLHNRSSIKDKRQGQGCLTRFTNSRRLDFFYLDRKEKVSIISELTFAERRRVELRDVLRTKHSTCSYSV